MDVPTAVSSSKCVHTLLETTISAISLPHRQRVLQPRPLLIPTTTTVLRHIPGFLSGPCAPGRSPVRPPVCSESTLELPDLIARQAVRVRSLAVWQWQELNASMDRRGARSGGYGIAIPSENV